MNEKTGFRETSAAIMLFALSPSVLYLTANLSSTLNAGAWINFIINSGYVFAIAFIVQRYFECFDSDIIESSALVCGKTFSKLIGIAYFLFVFLYTAFNAGLYTESISRLGFFAHSEEYISVLPVVAAVICAYSGIEGNTRFAYTIFFIALAITFFCIFSTYKAWDMENMFPVFGTSAKTTFFTFSSIAAYPGLAALFLVNGHIGDNSKVKSCLWRCFGGVFVFGIIMLIIYTLSVPYPTNSNFAFTSEGFFSSTLSGEVFHRFEIFLISINILFDICATSFGILLCAMTLSKIVGGSDFRPFVLILGVVVFYFGLFGIAVERYIRFCTVMTVFTFLIPVAVTIASGFKGKERNNTP